MKRKAFILALAALIGAAACNVLTPAESASVAADGVKLGACYATAHLCKISVGDASRAKCWDEFDACMVAHGYADAGPDRKPLDPWVPDPEPTDASKGGS